ncbi:MAG: hypothetical protein ABI538_10570 [Pseudoxanthomonas sp.]
MQTRRKLLVAACLSLLAASASAQSLDPTRTGLLPVPANRIVGLWHVSVRIGPCLGGPTQTFLALANYHAGGTLSDANTMPPAARGPGQGIWSFQGRNQYQSRFQFYRYLPNGSYDGLQDIQGVLVLDARATHYTQTIHAQVLNIDGSVRADLCGSAAAERVAMTN